jgi:small conductance mechanosensitive channel
VSYDSDVKLAKDILLNLLKEQENILEDPEPMVVVTELADSSVNFSVRFWAINEHFWTCSWYTIEEAKVRLEAAELPFHSLKEMFISMTIQRKKALKQN